MSISVLAIKMCKWSFLAICNLKLIYLEKEKCQYLLCLVSLENCKNYAKNVISCNLCYTLFPFKKNGDQQSFRDIYLNSPKGYG